MAYGPRVRALPCHTSVTASLLLYMTVEVIKLLLIVFNNAGYIFFYLLFKMNPCLTDCISKLLKFLKNIGLGFQTKINILHH